MASIPASAMVDPRDEPDFDPAKIAASWDSTVRPKPHQFIAMRDLLALDEATGKTNVAFILHDEPGMGKTKTCAVSILRWRPDAVFVVVCPVNVVNPWVQEIWNAIPDSKHQKHVLIYPRDKEMVYTRSRNIVGMVMSYHQVGQDSTLEDIELLKQTGRPVVLVVDEAHAVTSLKAVVTKHMLRLRCQMEHIALLTATPMANRPEELQNLWVLLGRGPMSMPGWWKNRTDVHEIRAAIAAEGGMVGRQRSAVARIPKLRQNVTVALTIAQALCMSYVRHGFQGCTSASSSGEKQFIAPGMQNQLAVLSQRTTLLISAALLPWMASSFLLAVDGRDDDSVVSGGAVVHPGVVDRIRALYGACMSRGSSSRDLSMEDEYTVHLDHDIDSCRQRWALAKEIEREFYAPVTTPDHCGGEFWTVEMRADELRLRENRSVDDQQAAVLVVPISEPAVCSANDNDVHVDESAWVKECKTDNNHSHALMYHAPSPWALAETSWLCRYFMLVFPIHISRREKMVIYIERRAVVMIRDAIQAYVTFLYETQRHIFGASAPAPVVHIYHGELNKGQRSDTLARFRSEASACAIFVTRAGGAGTNLVPANVVFAYTDDNFNDLYARQALGRCDRLTQARVVREVTLQTFESSSITSNIVQMNKAFRTSVIVGTGNAYLMQYPRHLQLYWSPSEYQDLVALLPRVGSDQVAAYDHGETSWPVESMDACYDQELWVWAAHGGLDPNDEALRIAQRARRSRVAAELTGVCLLGVLHGKLKDVVSPIAALVDMALMKLLCDSERAAGNEPQCGLCSSGNDTGHRSTDSLLCRDVPIGKHFNIPRKDRSVLVGGLPLMTTRQLFRYFFHESVRITATRTSHFVFPYGCGYGVPVSEEDVKRDEDWMTSGITSDATRGDGRAATSRAWGDANSNIQKMDTIIRRCVLRLSDMMVYLDMSVKQARDATRGPPCQPGAVAGMDFSLRRFASTTGTQMPWSIASSLGTAVLREVAPYVGDGPDTRQESVRGILDAIVQRTARTNLATHVIEVPSGV